MKYLASLFALLLLAGCGQVQLTQPVGGISCEVGGLQYAAGQANIPAGDGCNVCICGSDGELACTEMACEPMPEPAEESEEQVEEVTEETPTEETAEEVVVDDVDLVTEEVPTTETDTLDIGYSAPGGGELVITRGTDAASLVVTARDLPELAAEDRYLAELRGTDTELALGELGFDDTASAFTLSVSDLSLAGFTQFRIIRHTGDEQTVMIDTPLQ